jgi:transposase
VVKLMQRVRATGSVEPARIGGYRKPLLAAHEGTIRELVAANGSITLAELQRAIVEGGGPAVSLWAVWSMLQRLGLRHKKSR